MLIKNWNTDWKDPPYWEMTDEEQIEYEVYADGVEMRELILSAPNEDWRYSTGKKKLS